MGVSIVSEKRTEGFRIGTYRGKLLPTISSDSKNLEDREYKIQRDLYHIGRLKILYGRDDEKNIMLRLFAYEVPLSNGKRIDLLGYDADFNMWIIEVKQVKSSAGIDDVKNQINEYEKLLMNSKKEIEAEFREAFLLPDFTFLEIKKMVLAPRKFYVDKVIKKDDNDILYCSFARIADEKELSLVEDAKGKGYVDLRIEK